MLSKTALVFGLFSALAFNVSAINNSTIVLPYEVEETLLSLLNKTELDDLDISNRSIVPIYRKDLDPNYIAYYEIDLQGQYYFVLSAGPKTGDFKEAQSGPPPLPTNSLKKQAKKAGQKCVKFYLLCSMGIYMCENAKGVAVAATYNWTAAAPVSDWKSLQKMVDDSLKNITLAWKNVSKSSKEDWEISCQRQATGEKPNLKKFTAKVVSPGTMSKVSLENCTKITIHAIPASKQKQLCAILENVCDGKSKDVNQKLIQKSKCGIKYLEFQVKNDTSILKNKEISFYFEIVKDEKEKLLVYFSVDLGKGASKRSDNPIGVWREWTVDREDLFPDYDQHKCCGCWSGCVPVAWTMILGYYDRVAHNQPNSMIAGFTKKCWSKDDGNGGIAPTQLNQEVKDYVIGLRKVLKTYCTTGGGATEIPDIPRIKDFLNKRKIPSKVYKDWNQRKRGDRFRDVTAKFIKDGYPVHVAIILSSGGGHAVAATRYRERPQEYRECRGTSCTTKVWTEKEVYLHMGWGGNSNGWKKPDIYATYVILKKDANTP